MNKTPMKCLALAALAAFALSASAQEQNPGRTQIPPDQYKQKRLADLDANKDGAVNADEYLASKRSQWSSLAKGDKMTVTDCSKSYGDGKTEAKSASGRSWADRSKQSCAKLDKNGDGQLTWEEFGSAQWGRFKNLDKNGDGQLDPKELASHPTMRKSGRAAMESARASAASGQANSNNPMATFPTPNEEQQALIQKDLAASNAKVVKPRTAQEVKAAMQAKVEMARNGQKPAATAPTASEAAQARLTQQRLMAGKPSPNQAATNGQPAATPLSTGQAAAVEAPKEPSIAEKVQGWLR